MKKRTLFLVVLLGYQYNAFCQNNPLKISGNDLEVGYLKEGQNNYLVYVEKGDGTILDIAIWERNISFSKYNGEDVIAVSQHWKNHDSVRSRVVQSIVKKENLNPIYHYSENGRGIKEAFDFTENTVKGTDTVVQNDKKDFYLELKEPTFNWELDLEMFQCLPYQKSKVFRIGFYHPGGRIAPAFYNYEVIGEESIIFDGSKKIECWLLQLKQKDGNKTTFWITKNTREVMKMEEQWKGIRRYKIKFHG